MSLALTPTEVAVNAAAGAQGDGVFGGFERTVDRAELIRGSKFAVAHIMHAAVQGGFPGIGVVGEGGVAVLNAIAEKGMVERQLLVHGGVEQARIVISQRGIVVHYGDQVAAQTGDARRGRKL